MLYDIDDAAGADFAGQSNDVDNCRKIVYHDKREMV